MLKTINVQTCQREELLDISEMVVKIIMESDIKEGVCVVYTPHTTAALTINSCLDMNTPLDLRDEIKRLVPIRVDFHHMYDTPADAAGHIKSSLIGCNLALIISDQQLLLGPSQSILFWEFDGPRKRQVFVKLIDTGSRLE